MIIFNFPNDICIVLIFVYIYCKPISGLDTPSSYQVRTKAAPSSLHACIGLASFSHKVRSVSAAVSRFTCGKSAGLPYPKPGEFGVGVPALERTKSEQRAKKKHQETCKSILIVDKIRLQGMRGVWYNLRICL
jgi:hypothetical protein